MAKQTRQQILMGSIPYIVIAIIISSIIQVTPEPGDNPFITFVLGIALRAVAILVVIALVEFIVSRTEK